ncbi:hypothetical protein OHA21_08205 [Actinoplanes sp. NBC_00393]|uniref:hypothetical protein n=1 Tax=Actinoplanes sp. NBC_00393 TaxID=2975953 RepID=UPI002E229E99
MRCRPGGRTDRTGVLNDQIQGDLTAGRRRPEWLWVALRGGRVTTRAGWWSRPGDAQLPARQSAEEQYRDELERYPTPHDWWRVATLPGGEPAGFVIPAWR